MKMIAVCIVTLVGLAVSLGFLLRLEAPEEQVATMPQSVSNDDRGAGNQQGAVRQPAPALTDDSEPMAIVEDDWQPDPQVIANLRESLKNGDARAPTIGKSTPRATPEDAILDRPDLYQDFEASQEKKLYAAFVTAAREKEAWLQDEIGKARQAGLPEAQLREGVEKLRRIQEMRTAFESGTTD